MKCDLCGAETSVLNYAINHHDDMDLCADCFSHMPEERRGDYTQQPRQLTAGDAVYVDIEGGLVGTPRPSNKGTLSTLLGMVQAVNGGSIPFGFGQAGGGVARMTPDTDGTLNLSFGPPTEPSFEVSSTDLGEWDNTPAVAQRRSQHGINQELEYYATTTTIRVSHWEGARAQLLRRKEEIKRQRARIKWLEDENAQLRERLDRAKRGM